VWAILSVILCWPLAIPAIVFSTQVNSKWAMGDVAGAQDASQKAKKFAMWAAIAGVIGFVLYWLAFILFLGTSSMIDS
jgi:heme/copper-type cytochrome/quinol oxidase subunit 2